MKETKDKSCSSMGDFTAVILLLYRVIQKEIYTFKNLFCKTY
jgi:hypothetical protein